MLCNIFWLYAYIDTLAHNLSCTGSLECLRVLLEAGADVAKLCEGSPALHMAVSVGSIPHQQPFSAAAVQLLLQHGAVPYERCEDSAVLYAS